eukprot:CAMPEP_0171990594 /NCGR_PEP_ID=MMETSP0993-20121228/277003_1 /TAXON_ID=483369 /ORGANISM="non described non described, Strain CCMP2098" /LENGTH=111 /DNA_ID=CAMNT_0012643607 /DNA_START=999 /DNA_END=1334 /DNA_ORIENTATION=-
MAKFDLKFFMTRARVLAQYRAFLRASQRLRQRDESMALDVRERIYQGFRSQTEDDFAVRKLLADGARQLTLLESLCDDGRNLTDTAGESGDVDDSLPAAAGRPTWPWERVE